MCQAPRQMFTDSVLESSLTLNFSGEQLGLFSSVCPELSHGLFVSFPKCSNSRQYQVPTLGSYCLSLSYLRDILVMIDEVSYLFRYFLAICVAFW